MKDNEKMVSNIQSMFEITKLFDKLLCGQVIQLKIWYLFLQFYCIHMNTHRKSFVQFLLVRS